jgi:hypothetical protein
MLTNPFETQMVRSLGVKVGGAAGPPEPFENLRANLRGLRTDGLPEPGSPTDVAGGGCPFAAALGAEPAAAEPSTIVWDAGAEARLERVPSFIRPMARRSIERYAEGKGYRVVTDVVMDEAREVFGM